MDNPKAPAATREARANRAHELTDYSTEIQTLIRTALIAAEKARATFDAGESSDYVSADFADLTGALGLLNREASRTAEEWKRIAAARDRHC